MALRLFCDRCSSEVPRRTGIRSIEMDRKRVDLCDPCFNGLNYWLHKPLPAMRDRKAKGK